MTTEQLVSRYERGAITHHEFLVWCLDLIDLSDAGTVLKAVPSQLHGELLAILEGWRRGAMLSNHGPVTTPEENVKAAAEWLGVAANGPGGAERAHLEPSRRA